jgi:hypothetical protein
MNTTIKNYDKKGFIIRSFVEILTISVQKVIKCQK